MRGYSLIHLSDADLRHDLSRVVTHERDATADVIAHIAEYQARRLYARDGCPNMSEYCTRVLRFSEDAAWRRTHAAATAHRYPIIFSMLADGRLHLTAVCLLAPHLTPVNAGELLEAATHRSRKEIEALLAERFPRPDEPARITPLSNVSQPSLIDVAASSDCAEPSDGVDKQPCASAPARKTSPFRHSASMRSRRGASRFE